MWSRTKPETNVFFFCRLCTVLHSLQPPCILYHPGHMKDKSCPHPQQDLRAIWVQHHLSILVRDTQAKVIQIRQRSETVSVLFRIIQVAKIDVVFRNCTMHLCHIWPFVCQNDVNWLFSDIHRLMKAMKRERLRITITIASTSVRIDGLITVLQF